MHVFDFGLQITLRCKAQPILLLFLPGKPSFSGSLHFTSHRIHADFCCLCHTSAIDLPLNWAVQRADQIGRLLQELNFLFIVLQIILFGNCSQLVFHPIAGLLKQQLETICSKLFQKLVRIFSVPHLQDLHLQAGLLKNRNGTLRGVLSRAVSIINQHNLIRISAEQSSPIFRQCSTKRSNRAIKSILV